MRQLVRVSRGYRVAPWSASWRRAWRVVPVLGVLGTPLPGARAQQVPQLPGDSVLAAELTTAIKTDTTDFALGHKDFRHYTTPGFCLAAVRHQLTIARRSIATQEAADTMRRYAAQDTLPAAVAAVANACAAQFAVASTPAVELAHLFQLALLARQDTLAQAVLTRRLSLAVTPSAKTALLLEVLNTYLAASPARVAAAEAVLARLDALGQSAAVLPLRLRAHYRMLAFADTAADWARVRQEATQVLTLARALPDDSLNTVGSWALDAYKQLGRLVYLQGLDSMTALARQLQQDAKRNRTFNQANTGTSYATLPLDTVVQWFVNLVGWGGWGAPDTVGARLGQPTPPLHADFWFPATDTVVPVRGRLSLLIAVPSVCYGGYNAPYVLDPIQVGCQQFYRQLRRWHAQYGPKVDITLVARTGIRGGTVLSGPQTPAEAAKNLNWFFRDYLKLPVQRVAVEILPRLAPLPAPDGRSFLVPGVQQDRFAQVYHVPTVLTSQDGRLLAGSSDLSWMSPLLEVVIDSPGPAPTLAPAPVPTPPPSAASAHR